MQRTAVQRIEDLLGFGFYSIFMVYNLRWDVAYIHEVFWLHQTDHLFDLVILIGLTILFGFTWGVIVWNVFQYHTFPWLVRNLVGYAPVVDRNLAVKLVYRFWYGLALVLIGLMKHLLVVTSWVTHRAWPGRGITFNMDFADERDFKNMLHTANEDGLPITASVDGRLIDPEEYDAPLSQHDLLGGVYHPTYDEDILDTSLTFPSFAAIHVVDADPTEC